MRSDGNHGRGRRRARIVAVVLWLALVAGAVGAVFALQRSARRGAEAQFRLRTSESASFAQFYVEESLRRQRDQAVKLLSAPAPEEGSFELVTLSLGYSTAALLDDAGRVLDVAPANPALIGQDLSSYEHLRQAAAGRNAVSGVITSAVTGRNAVSGEITSAVTGRPIVAFAVPFDTPAGRRVFSGGFYAADTPLASFLAHDAGGRGEAYLIDAGSAIVATSGDPVVPGETLRSHSPALADALGRRPAGVVGSGRTSSYFTSAPVRGTPWRMVVAVPTAVLYAPIDGSGETIAWELAAALALGGLAIVVLALRVSDSAAARRATLAALEAKTTELAAARDEAIHSAEGLADTQRLAHLGRWEWDIPTQVVTWSEELYRIFGCEPGQFEPSYENFLLRVHPVDRIMVEDMVSRCLQTQEPGRYNARIFTLTGELRWIDTWLAVEAGAEGAPLRMVGTAMDITERKRAEEDLASLNAELERRVEERTAEAERANEAKSEFLSRMSHELRTPLNAMLGFAQLLGMDELSPDQAQSVEHIMSGGRHLLGLINEVLDLARIESGHLAVSIEPVALSVVLEEALDLIRPQAAITGVSLPVQAPEGANLHVMVDQQRLRQIVVNLLSNAVKYNSEAGTVTLGCERRDDGRLRLAVTDTGAGISHEEAERLFMPFERLGAATSGVEGTGLGLAVSRRLADAMGAEIGLTSVVGQGSTFWVELCVVEAAETQPATPAFAEGEPGSGAEAVTVLHIEDNPSNRRLVEALLSRLPHVRLLSAGSGHLGLEVATERRPELILLDLGLPDISGAEVLASLRADPATANIPVVIVSADATESQVRRLLAAGATAYVTKPLDVGLFLSVVDEALQPAAA